MKTIINLLCTRSTKWKLSAVENKVINKVIKAIKFAIMSAKESANGGWSLNLNAWH